MKPAQVIAWRTLDQTHRQFFVSELPGEGGKDYGYTDDRAKARAMTVSQAKRFLAYVDACGATSFGTQAATVRS